MPDARYSFGLNPPRVYERLADGKEAVYVLAPEGSRIVVTEIVVRGPRPWGVSQRDLRGRSPRAAVAAFRDFLIERQRSGAGREAWAMVEEIAAATGQTSGQLEALAVRWAAEDPWRDVVATLRQPGPGMPRLHRLTLTAAMYVQAMADGERAPNEAVAQQQGRRASHVRDDLKRARDAGLLERLGGQGQAGGDLTDKAREILRTLLAEIEETEK